MLVLFCFVLMIGAGCCADVTQNNASFSCPHQTANQKKTYRIKIIFSHQTEVLEGTMSCDSSEDHPTPLTTNLECATLILDVNQTKINPNGLSFFIQTGTPNKRVFPEAQSAGIPGECKLEDLKRANTALYIICTALTMSMIVSVYLIWTNKKKNCDNFSFPFETEAEPTNSDQQGDEASVTYSTPTFSETTVTKAERRNMLSDQKETIYNDVRFTTEE
ncbi:uncharacterized protein LOC115407073 isoform X2 [Salarias fasciatus]|uniref:uncharacterized protein LOC115407073 isoform X2 n=1 Tax=Salarias fasciatus TaxID=181472 RepID=UPI001176FD5F|nr:uncharacterized protein LOC115407073 isoform X2 [Salarias fasciatus]